MSRFLLCAFAAVLLSASLAFAQAATGVPPFSTVIGGPEAINPGNLNAHWDFPFYHRAGRGMPFSYVMSYDSSVWNAVASGSTASWQPVANFGWRGQSEALTGFIKMHTSQGQCRGPSNPDGTFSFGFYTLYNFQGYQDGAGVFHSIPVTLVDGSGSEICTSPVDSVSSGSATANDGSGYTLSVTNFTQAVVTSRGGVTINAPSLQNGSGSIVGTNGNILTTTVNTSSNTTTFTDTLGTAALTVSGAAPLVTYTYTDPNGNPAVVKMNYTQFTVATNFGVSGISEYRAASPTYLVTSIDLPNGTSYRFSYEPTPSSPAAGACSGCVTGRIASVTLPTGGAISYNYTGGNNGMASDGATSGFDRTTPDGTWHFVRNGALTTVTDPAGNETMYEFWSGIYESSRRYYQGKGSDGTGKLLAEIDTCWNDSCTAGSVTLPITKRSATMSYPDGVKRNTTTLFNNLGLPTEADEYDFPDGGASSPPKLKTIIAYDTTLGSIHDRPHQVTMEDGAATPNVASQTTYTYDEAAYCCASPTASTPQHVTVSGSRGNPTTITSQVNSRGAAITRHISYYDTGAVQSTYDAKGNIVATANFPDATSTCGNSFPASVTTAGALTTSTVWNCSCGIPTSATDANNQLTKFQYDNMYRLTQITRPDQITLSTNFNDAVPPIVTQSSSANSAETVMNLDGLGRVTSKILETAGTPVSTVAIQYDSLGRLYKTSNPYSGSETPLFTTTSFDALGRPLSITPNSGGSTQFSYFDNTVAVTDPSGKQRRSYTDGLGRLIQVDEPAPGQTTAGVASTGVINITGAETTVTSSGAKATGSFTVNGSEQVFTIPKRCSPDPDTGLFICSGPSTTYDSGSISVTVNGFTSSTTYGRNSTPAGLAPILAGGFNVAGSPVAANYPGSGTTVYLTANQPGPNYALSQNSSTDDTADFGGASFSSTLSGSTLTGGVYPVTKWDSGAITLSLGNLQVQASYNQNVNTTAQALAQALALQLNSAASPVTAVVNQISSSQSQIVMTAKAVGTPGNLAVSSSANTASYQFSITTTSGASTTAMTGGADPQKTTYSYDLLNDLTQVNQGQQVRIYNYDQLGRLTSAATPESGTVTYSYLNSAGANCSGNPSAICFSTDARGVTVTNTYADPLSRLAQVDYAVGTSGVPATPSVGYTYGTNPAQNNNGRLLKMTDGLGSETYSYDILGRVTQVSRAVTGTALPFNIGYGYNQADQLTSITYPSGRVVQQNYDLIGRLSSILSGTTTYLSVPSTGGYNSAQLPLALNYGSGVAGSFQYNDHLQMSSLNYSLNGTSLLNLGYNYLDAQQHNNGQIQGITDSRGDAFSTLFTYDPLGRLIHAQTKDLASANTWNLLWNYDIYGNRLSQSAGTPPGTLTTGAPQLSVDPLTNRISMAGFVYDAAGNLTHDPSHSYTYNAEGELTAVDGTTSYAYDGHRWRMEKTSSGATTVYIYSGSKVLAEYASGAAPTSPSKEYVYSGGSLLATLSGSSITYHYPDHLSNRLETNSAGTVTRTFGHLPFGETWYETGTPDKWKFTGYERDTSESGLDYAMNRMYSSGFGRFETADLLAGRLLAPQTLDKYSYVHGDPIRFTDPGGTCDVIIGGITQFSGKQNSTEQQTIFANSIGGDMVFPYSDGGLLGGFVSGISEVGTQGLGLRTTNTATVAAALLDAAAQTPSGEMINVFTFSGGAQAFTTAIEAMPELQGRIGNVTYISPGNTSALWNPGDHGNALVLSNPSTFSADDWIGLGGSGNADTAYLDCAHNANCAFSSAGPILAARSGSPCSTPKTFSNGGTDDSGLFVGPNTDEFRLLDLLFSAIDAFFPIDDQPVLEVVSHTINFGPPLPNNSPAPNK